MFSISFFSTINYQTQSFVVKALDDLCADDELEDQKRAAKVEQLSMALREMVESSAVPFSTYEHFFETYLGLTVNEVADDTPFAESMLVNLNAIIIKGHYRQVLQLLENNGSCIRMLGDLAEVFQAAGNMPIQKQLVKLFWKLGRAQIEHENKTFAKPFKKILG